MCFCSLTSSLLHRKPASPPYSTNPKALFPTFSFFCQLTAYSDASATQVWIINSSQTAVVLAAACCGTMRWDAQGKKTKGATTLRELLASWQYILLDKRVKIDFRKWRKEKKKRSSRAGWSAWRQQLQHHFCEWRRQFLICFWKMSVQVQTQKKRD